MTSYQARKKEIANLEKKVFLLEQKLIDSGIEFGQLSISDQAKQKHEKVKSVLEKDEYGLYVNAHGYAETRSKLDARKNRPKPPAPLLARIILHPPIHPICPKCGSSMPRSGFMRLFGKRKCLNEECINSKP